MFRIKYKKQDNICNLLILQLIQKFMICIHIIKETLI